MVAQAGRTDVDWQAPVVAQLAGHQGPARFLFLDETVTKMTRRYRRSALGASEDHHD